MKRVNGNAAGPPSTTSTFDGTADRAADRARTTADRPGTLTLPANKPTATFKVPITKDTVDEGNETVLLRLSNPRAGGFRGGRGCSTTAVLTITDNDTGGKIRFSSANYSVSEGAGSREADGQAKSEASASGVSVAYVVSPVGPSRRRTGRITTASPQRRAAS